MQVQLEGGESRSRVQWGAAIDEGGGGCGREELKRKREVDGGIGNGS